MEEAMAPISTSSLWLKHTHTLPFLLTSGAWSQPLLTHSTCWLWVSANLLTIIGIYSELMRFAEGLLLIFKSFHHVDLVLKWATLFSCFSAIYVFIYMCTCVCVCVQDLNKRLSLPADIRIPDGYLEKLQLSSPPFDQPLSRRSRRASLVRRGFIFILPQFYQEFPYWDTNSVTWES